MKGFKSLNTRLIAFTLVIVTVCAVGFLLLSMRENEAIYTETALSHLDVISDNLSDDLLPYLGAELDSFALATELLDLQQYPNVLYANVYNPAWISEQLYVAPAHMQALESGADTLLEGKQFRHGISFHEQHLIALKVIGEPDFPQGHLFIVQDFQGPLQQSRRELITSSLPMGLGILACTVLISGWANRRLLAPLRKLTEFTSTIDTAESFGKRFFHHRKDEVGALSAGINAMLTRIEADSRQSEEANATLKLQQQELITLANNDMLTGLPNRTYLMETLRRETSRAKRRENNLIVMFLDLDNFKTINDSLGHDTGDEFLCKISSMIRAQLRDEDLLSRFGGDEFVILLTEIEGNLFEVAVKLAERIIGALSQPVSLHEWEVQSGVSIGIADAKTAHYDTDAIVSNADIAMYQAKESGRNTFRLFQQNLQEEVKRKMQIVSALPKALANDEFDVFYQIKVNDSLDIAGVEALIRWHSELYGFVSPGEFIPIAEQSGKISAISHWVFDRVVRDIDAIQALAEQNVVVSINLSAQDMVDKYLLQHIEKTLAANDKLSSLLEFEVTESAYLDNFEEADGFFKKIHRTGCSIALDDFGTGYSSLSYLTRIQMDTLKIDQHFIRNFENSESDRLIIEAIISLAHNLKLKICAEGIETEAQSHFLFSKGCQQLQGYLYAKPVPLADLPAAVETIQSLHQSSNKAVTQ